MRMKKSTYDQVSHLIVRDARHSKDGPQRSGPARPKKNLDKFCEGNPQLPHIVDASNIDDFGSKPRQEIQRACGRCGQDLLLIRNGVFFEQRPNPAMWFMPTLEDVYMYDGTFRLKVDKSASYRKRNERRRARTEAYREFNLRSARGENS
jgi:hypothetical protein